MEARFEPGDKVVYKGNSRELYIDQRNWVEVQGITKGVIYTVADVKGTVIRLHNPSRGAELALWVKQDCFEPYQLPEFTDKEKRMQIARLVLNDLLTDVSRFEQYYGLYLKNNPPA